MGDWTVEEVRVQKSLGSLGLGWGVIRINGKGVSADRQILWDGAVRLIKNPGKSFSCVSCSDQGSKNLSDSYDLNNRPGEVCGVVSYCIFHGTRPWRIIFSIHKHCQYSSYSSWPVSVYQWCAHSRLVVSHNLYRGQRYTILCPYFINCATLYRLLLPQLWESSVLTPLL